MLRTLLFLQWCPDFTNLQVSPPLILDEMYVILLMMLLDNWNSWAGSGFSNKVRLSPKGPVPLK